jgi:hypothetical protein
VHYHALDLIKPNWLGEADISLKFRLANYITIRPNQKIIYLALYLHYFVGWQYLFSAKHAYYLGLIRRRLLGGGEVHFRNPIA